MKIFNFKDMKGGWFIGDFEPSAYKTKGFEVCYKEHRKDEIWETHYHKIATEINLLITGKMIIQDITIAAGDIFVLKPGEIADPTFLEDCSLIVVKTPSITNDKYEVKK
tara:strand:+ start:2375 stop:2701 length:327 start_codon:yes stop_codon:yes gene_type:complete